MANPNYRHSFRFNYLYIVFRPFGNGRLPLFSIPHLVEHDPLSLSSHYFTLFHMHWLAAGLSLLFRGPCFSIKYVR